MHFIFSIFIALLVLLAVLVGYFVTNMWKQAAGHSKNGIPYLGVRVLSTVNFLFGRVNLLQAELELYQAAKQANKPLVAVTDFVGQFALLVTDVNLLKNILIKDFDHFVNRRPVHDNDSGSVSTRFLPAMENSRWKVMRAKISPTFTTGKVRKMFKIFESSGQQMISYLQKEINNSVEGVDLACLFPKYSMDVIANCAFGVDSGTLKLELGQKSTFEKMAQLLQFQFSGKFLLRFLLITMVPKFAKWVGIQQDDVVAQEYYSKVIKSVIKQRREKQERCEDFLQLLLDVQQGLLEDDDASATSLVENRRKEESISVPQPKLTLEDDDIIANSLLFIMAGFEPTQTILLFALYSLSLERDIQEKCFLEIVNRVNDHNGRLTYDAVVEMTYLDSVISETIRLYSPSTRLERACNKDYTAGDVMIKKGSVLLVPIHGIHRDPNYYPNPSKFDPERFTKTRKSDRNPMTYLPFGHGPRNCLASRFALVKVKTALAQMILSFHFEPCRKTTIPMEFGSNASAKPKHGMWLKLTRRQNP